MKALESSALPQHGISFIEVLSFLLSPASTIVACGFSIGALISMSGEDDQSLDLYRSLLLPQSCILVLESCISCHFSNHVIVSSCLEFDAMICAKFLKSSCIRSPWSQGICQHDSIVAMLVAIPLTLAEN